MTTATSAQGTTPADDASRNRLVLRVQNCFLVRVSDNLYSGFNQNSAVSPSCMVLLNATKRKERNIIHSVQSIDMIDQSQNMYSQKQNVNKQLVGEKDSYISK